METIKIFIGSCIHNLKAEIALEYSIRKNTERDTEIIWMRTTAHGDPAFQDWNKYRWGTGFSLFRWVVPELCNFEGKAIYMDVDMLVLGDIGELWDSPIPEDKAVYSIPNNSSVMLMDCAKFKSLEYVRSIESLKKENAEYMDVMMKGLREGDLVVPLDKAWNCFDGEGYIGGQTKLIHYTGLSTQPWAPTPHLFDQERHKNLIVYSKWFEYYEEAIHVFYRENSDMVIQH